MEFTPKYRLLWCQCTQSTQLLIHCYNCISIQFIEPSVPNTKELSMLFRKEVLNYPGPQKFKEDISCGEQKLKIQRLDRIENCALAAGISISNTNNSSIYIF